MEGKNYTFQCNLLLQNYTFQTKRPKDFVKKTPRRDGGVFKTFTISYYILLNNYLFAVMNENAFRGLSNLLARQIVPFAVGLVGSLDG